MRLEDNRIEPKGAQDVRETKEVKYAKKSVRFQESEKSEKADSVRRSSFSASDGGEDRTRAIQTMEC